MDEISSLPPKSVLNMVDEEQINSGAEVGDGVVFRDGTPFLEVVDNSPSSGAGPKLRTLLGGVDESDVIPSPGLDLPQELFNAANESGPLGLAPASAVAAPHKLDLSALPKDKVLSALQEKVTQTQGVTVQGNYLVNFEGDFLRGLRQLSWLSEEDRALAAGLMNHHVIRSVSTNPSLDFDPEVVAQLRHQAGLDVSKAFGADWDAYLCTLTGPQREATAAVLDLVSNLARLHDMRSKKDMSAFEMREGAIAQGPAGLSSALGSVVGSLSTAGSSFIKGLRRGASERNAAKEVDAVKHLNAWASEPVMGQPAPPVDIDPASWREEQTKGFTAEIERLSIEMTERAGDPEWENGRGLEVASDLQVAINGLDEILESGLLSEERKRLLREKMEESVHRVEEAEQRMVSEKMRELVHQTAEAISGLVKKMVASVVKVANSITGAGGTDEATPPQSVGNDASPLAPEGLEVHDFNKAARQRPR